MIAAVAAFGMLLCASCGTNGESENGSTTVTRDASDTNDYAMNELTEMKTALSWNADWYPAKYDAQNNPVYDLYESALNIKMVNKFALNFDGYEQQITSGIITGDLPEVFFVNNKMLDELIRNDLLIDLKPYYDLWGTDELKSTLEYNKDNFAYPTRNGKLYGIPKVADDCDRATVWARKDWIDRLNSRDNSGKTIWDKENGLRYHANGPQSLEEYWDLAYAFAKEDPDGNGKRDTYGIAISKDLDATVLPIYNAYGAYPTTFVRKEDGSFENLGIKEEMKKPLQKLAQCVKDGVINSDYVNWGGQDVWSKAASGYAGLVCGPAYLPLWPLSNTLAYGGEWVASPMFAEDGKEFVQTRVRNVSGYYVVVKGYKHPEALIKILNNLATSDENNAWYKGYMAASEPAENASIFNWMPISIDRSTVNFERHTAIMHAIESYEKSGEFDLSMIEARDMVRWNQVKNYYLYKADAGWAMYKTFCEGVTVAKSYKNEGIYTDWVYSDTPTIKARSASLDDMGAQTRAKIIAGKLDISAFDDYVTDWLEGGGSKICKEMKAYVDSLSAA